MENEADGIAKSIGRAVVVGGEGAHIIGLVGDEAEGDFVFSSFINFRC